MLRHFVATVCVLSCVGTTFGEDDAAKAKALIEKAIKAQKWEGDPEKGMITWKEKGKFTGGGFEMDYTSTWTTVAPGKFRADMQMELMGAKFNFLLVCNGEKSWASAMNQVEEMKDEKAEYTLNNAYKFYVNSLKPLLSDKQFTLKITKGVKVGDAETEGIVVSSKGKPDITIYFDTKTGYLARMSMKVKDEFSGWKEVPDDAYFSGWKEEDNRMVFTKLKIIRDGKTMIESEESDLKFVEKVDDKLFEKPE